MKYPKILLIKPPLDGHDRPIHDLIVLLRKYNIDSVWPGLQQSWPQIVKTAVEEDPDAIGISVHTGDPVALLGHLKTKFDEAGLGEKILVAGGSGEITFPDVREKLSAMGFKVFLSATSHEEIAKYILERFKEKERKRQSEFVVQSAISRNILASAITHQERGALILQIPIENNSKTVVLGGPTGAGKSSILNAVLERFGRHGTKIAVFLCDPRGPKIKGAFLGDRIVLQDHTLNENIFIRSVSQFGNYSKKRIAFLKKLADLAKHWGAKVIFFETIGLGQEASLAIKTMADLFLWVALPNETDDVRLMKGGAHEMADAILLNKIDQEPAFRAELALKERFQKPYFPVSATTGVGIDDFCKFLEEKMKA
ncbi:hypothetical protein A3G55_04100 [Candidatus Giovannonibacteria bacterium RIFCSPLOWO2_12_FULL_44_25]|uniref:Methylmalonyl-CoA mutase n=4 Tax=Parcubacteria group TaxID=1794811 RepID=A0A837IQR6_9BACT|nr:MAG: Methylmalonyl-CoA mutase protein [Parcubacteria group bacterium GW2011_GWC1_44_10]KKT56990.1 MAG: methylmalonyl-CoA mutase [Candidatus Giovannonibacteria bacterium GW2011_GWB1_44_23]KKT59601.1 MAG: methylmalonyl-CoA mutase [Candidatus Giovannonibacteria bacterium GW2011_GWA1_44_25]KKU12507.1 MAG: methylmalonyl-CoA mutase [Candidatus Azambacteria bacterium GW2011_GWC2_45_7b]OGF49855.1 MAG: hypothetical protein A2120_01385 [Candidatus Giovannonibacteria bacterium GWA2_45_15]OGF59398.1 MA